jgi:hypothetical protein
MIKKPNAESGNPDTNVGTGGTTGRQRMEQVFSVQNQTFGSRVRSRQFMPGQAAPPEGEVQRPKSKVQSGKYGTRKWELRSAECGMWNAESLPDQFWGKMAFKNIKLRNEP